MARAAPLSARSVGQRGAAAWPAGLLVLLALPCGCQAPSSGPLSVWIVQDLRRISAEDLPLPENEVYSASRGQVRLRAAINETVAFQVGLRTTAPPAGPFSIQITDLFGPGGPIEARTATGIYRVAPVRIEDYRSWYPAHTQRAALPRSFPDVLVPWEAQRGGGPLRLDGLTNEVLWVDLHVPVGTEPGVYSGALRLFDQSVPEPAFGERPPAFSAEIRLEVAPVALPGERNLKVICAIDPRDLLEEQLRWPRLKPEETRLIPSSPSHLAPMRLIQATMRLFHEHRTTPNLWASFPKFLLAGERTVEIDWDPYNELVSGWLDGSAFADQVGLAAYPLPVSLDYPDAEQNGGFESPRYARLLAAYALECQQHFERRGWLGRAFVRPIKPQDLTPEAVARVRRAAGILRQAGVTVPLVAHLPAGSLAGLGWHGAPPVDLSDVDVWAPPAAWFEPSAMSRQRSLGRQAWFQPDHPPYSPSLRVESPPGDVCALAWQAFRYGASAIWLERAAEYRGGPPLPAGERRTAAGEALIASGTPFGYFDRPLPTVRLKRLRRGIQDYELLRLLERSGRQLLAQRTAERIVRRGFTDACLENLLSVDESGWTADPYVLWLARRVMLQELSNTFVPSAVGRDEQVANLADWERVLSRAAQIRVRVESMRLTLSGGSLRGNLVATVANDTTQPLRGQWKIEQLPPGWRRLHEGTTLVAAGSRQRTTLPLLLEGLAYSADGTVPFSLEFHTERDGIFSLEARLPFTACPLVVEPPIIDGDLSDWPRGTNNSAADFRLVRGRAASPGSRSPEGATLPTRAYFCQDLQNIYVGVYCALRPDEPPRWQSDNRVPIDGAIPWGQDLVEVILSPANAQEGTPADLFLLQVKPSGLLAAYRGCPTSPPLAPVSAWQSGARVAASVTRDAWIAELALPIDSLGSAARRNPLWGVNVTRLDSRRGEYSSWSGARGHCYSPERLGNLMVVRP
jgi:hypothetical protein